MRKSGFSTPIRDHENRQGGGIIAALMLIGLLYALVAAFMVAAEHEADRYGPRPPHVEEAHAPVE